MLSSAMVVASLWSISDSWEILPLFTTEDAAKRYIVNRYSESRQMNLTAKKVNVLTYDGLASSYLNDSFHSRMVGEFWLKGIVFYVRGAPSGENLYASSDDALQCIARKFDARSFSSVPVYELRTKHYEPVVKPLSGVYAESNPQPTPKKPDEKPVEKASIDFATEKTEPLEEKLYRLNPDKHDTTMRRLKI